jgi:hypothetical protein
MSNDPTRTPLIAHSDRWFGLRPPDDAVAAWGARAISTHGTLDLVWSRMQCDPSCRGGTGEAPASPAHLAIHRVLDTYFLPLIRQRLAAGDCALRGTSADVTEVSSGAVTPRVSPNASGGYLYLVDFVPADRAPSEARDA